MDSLRRITGTDDGYGLERANGIAPYRFIGIMRRVDEIVDNGSFVGNVSDYDRGGGAFLVVSVIMERRVQFSQVLSTDSAFPSS